MLFFYTIGDTGCQKVMSMMPDLLHYLKSLTHP